MAEGTDLVPPLALPDDQDPLYSLYGFQIDKWLDHPVPNGVDWFPSEERCRRDANAYAYHQTGTKENWYRYLLLGFYVFDNCHECDKVWASIDHDPLQVHRSIWYNFQYHVDQSMDISPQLNAWAMNITSVYLAHFDPTTLHGTDTLAYSWKTMPFRTTMEIDDESDWIIAPGRKRSKSPPNAPKVNTRQVPRTEEGQLHQVSTSHQMTLQTAPLISSSKQRSQTHPIYQNLRNHASNHTRCLKDYQKSRQSPKRMKTKAQTLQRPISIIFILTWNLTTLEKPRQKLLLTLISQLTTEHIGLMSNGHHKKKLTSTNETKRD